MAGTFDARGWPVYYVHNREDAAQTWAEVERRLDALHAIELEMPEGTDPTDEQIAAIYDLMTQMTMLCAGLRAWLQEEARDA